MNKRYKVCHFSSVHKDNDIRVYAKECLSLADAGYDTTLIACDGQQRSESVQLTFEYILYKHHKKLNVFFIKTSICI